MGFLRALYFLQVFFPTLRTILTPPSLSEKKRFLIFLLKVTLVKAINISVFFSISQTLEISGWIRVMHGQPNRTEEPQLALFATCCPFGPLSLMDLPSRELTFKSKHKMDFSPLSMDNRYVEVYNYLLTH